MTLEMLENIWPEWQVDPNEEPLGRGSYGVVYKAVRRDHGIESYAAVKIISIPSDPSEVDSLRSEGFDLNATRTYFQEKVTEFVSEIKLMEYLKGHSNIVSVEDYKVVEKTDKLGWDIYIRMELLTSFNTYICDKDLSEEEVIRLGCDICTALEACGEKKIIHRDIKPENIFINDLGYFKLGDFGIARKLENMTGGLSHKGTYNYMAPEVASSMDYGASVDTYSLGIVLYRLMNGNRLPFMAQKQLHSPSEREEALKRRLRGEALPAPCDASPEMADLILRACAFDPAARFASAAEMKKALMDVSAGIYKKAYVSAPDDTIAVRHASNGNNNTVSEHGPEVSAAQQDIPEFNPKSSKNKYLPQIILTLATVVILVGIGIFAAKRISDPSDIVAETDATAAVSENLVSETTGTTAGVIYNTSESSSSENDLPSNYDEPEFTTTERITQTTAAPAENSIKYVPDVLTSYDLSYATEYSAKKNTDGESFQMAGSEYRNGIVLNNTSGSYQTCSITYNVVGDYSKISFYLGRLDNTNNAPIELRVYLDNVLYETYDMDADDPPKLVEIDVSGKTSIRFSSELHWRTGYCLANMSLDTEAKEIAPKANKVNTDSKYVPDVLTAYNFNYATEYSEKNSTEGESFQMSGTAYRNGVVLNNTSGSYETCSITYNVLGDYSKISFYLGRLDNTNREPIELKVYLDNVLYETYNMDADDPPKLIEVDVSGKTTIRFYSELHWRTGYCLANMSLDTKTDEIAPKANEVNTDSKYVPDVLSSYNLNYATEYSAKSSKDGESFQMSGSEYRNGVVLNNTSGSYEMCSITYNVLGDYSKISFYLGHLDNTNREPIELRVYLDNVLYESYNMEANDPPKLIEIDVSGQTTIRFYSELHWRTGYCLANMSLDTNESEIKPKANKVNTDSKYITDVLASYNLNYAEEYSEKKNTNGEKFQMIGKDYRNGTVLHNNSGSYQTCSITYNVLGDYSKLSFYLGHLDETNKEPIELKVYLDNVLYASYDMDADDSPKLIEIDVSGKTTIRFSSKLHWRTGYCLADATIV